MLIRKEKGNACVAGVEREHEEPQRSVSQAIGEEEKKRMSLSVSSSVLCRGPDDI